MPGRSIRQVDRHAPSQPPSAEVDPSATDVVLARPDYGTAGRPAVVDPAECTEAATRGPPPMAHHLARSPHARRAASLRTARTSSAMPSGATA
ncbi:DUF6194 family protein [Embleya sp. NPDC020630]|uniref:DUF6194 family protein n=1 Tax=Embleya sp. NPDC020630 TaxID=3363979 RepID=UPI0037B0282E